MNLFVATLRARDTDKSQQFSTNSLEFGIQVIKDWTCIFHYILDGIIHCFLFSQDDYEGLFKIADKGIIDNWNTVDLELLRPLDYEDFMFYRVIVIVTVSFYFVNKNFDIQQN